MTSHLLEHRAAAVTATRVVSTVAAHHHLEAGKAALGGALRVAAPARSGEHVEHVEVARAVLPGTATPEAFALIGDTVLFARDQVALTAEGRTIVTRQAQWLARNAGFTAVVEGHADEEGTADYNLALGARRAAAVQEYLIARGVAAGRITTVSYGRERPLEACDSEACFARNRRAVTVVAPAAGV